MMKLSAPRLITWWIALLFGVVGIISYLVIDRFQPVAIWVVVVALALMLVATATKGL